MSLDERVIVKEVEYPKRMNKWLLEKWLDTLPEIKSHDPEDPEWQPTPVYPLDLKPFGYNAVVFVKDESTNPTHTIKDRRAHEKYPVGYRAFAENLWRQNMNGSLRRVPIPRYSEISAGNIAKSDAIASERYDLPPPIHLLNIDVPEERLNELKQLRADLILAPLDRNIFTGKHEPYTTKQILKLTNNISGHDFTSSRIVQPHRDFYDWHWHEIFNSAPDEVYGPAGSREWFANGLTWQHETALNGTAKKDVRLSLSPEKVSLISILAGEPQRFMTSEADKLTGHMPFVYYKDNDVRYMKLNRFTGRETGVYKVPEEKIKLAYGILSVSGIKAEMSASAGLALFLDRYERGLHDSRKKVLIVNTGKGI